jgi:hypothetical protein
VIIVVHVSFRSVIFSGKIGIGGIAFEVMFVNDRKRGIDDDEEEEGIDGVVVVVDDVVDDDGGVCDIDDDGIDDDAVIFVQVVYIILYCKD